MKKLAAFVLIPASALVMVGGWAFWGEAFIDAPNVDSVVESVDRRVENVDRAVERVDRIVDERVARVDRLIEENDRRIDAIDRAIDHAIDRPNPHFQAEMDRLEDDIAAGLISRSDAIQQAIQASIDGGRGPGTPRSAPPEEQAAANSIFAEARDVLADAERDVREERDAGELSAEQYGDAMAAITRAQERIDKAERDAQARRSASTAE